MKDNIREQKKLNPAGKGSSEERKGDSQTQVVKCILFLLAVIILYIMIAMEKSAGSSVKHIVSGCLLHILLSASTNQTGVIHIHSEALLIVSLKVK